MACLGESLSLADRTVYKYSLGLSSVVNALRECYGASDGLWGERQKFLRPLQQHTSQLCHGRRGYEIKRHNVNTKTLRTN